ncbi:hypothetical protein FPOAC1_004995 [Fusarium poae]|uniref:hypothetical protein n=1 Tax=Fusarium poae TaxID=36050 RepID=UPI001CE8D3A4|nr:hypothetical protein FPOAC1_004995 [Fusarium poae]KAG8671740.1 hypothetical protein FPOAC1_004995 [Fusarium poae]
MAHKMLGQQKLARHTASTNQGFSSVKVRQMIGSHICHIEEATRTGGVKTLEFDNTLRYCNMLLASTPIKNKRINH